MCKGETIWAWFGGGPSERQQRVDFSAAGIPLTAPGVTDVWAGIDRVYNLLKEHRLLIHDCCVNLISEIGSYSRKKNKSSGEFTDAIENKEAYHGIDSLRYAIAGASSPV